VDFDAGCLTLLKSATQKGTHSLPLVFDQESGRPYVEADVLGCGPPERFVVDTGDWGSAGSLQEDLFDTLILLGKLQKVCGGREYSLGHESEIAIARLTRLGFGPFEHRQLLFDRSKESRLGLGFFSRYWVAFDFPAGRVYLRKEKRFDVPDGINRSGLLLLRPSGETVVEAVRPGSAGAEAGIKPGDILVSLGGLQADRTRLFVLQEKLCAAGQTLTLTLNRNGKLLKVSLKLEEDRRPTVRANGKP
jgi:hypothetical protein